jgi:nucleotide-binding universal stress UspA family protein
MPGIVCAIRGGPYSRPTIQKAIKLSKKSKQRIFFLYVVNLEFLSNALHSNVVLMEEEITQMGEFILFNAQETARKKGLEAEAVIRKGQVGHEIKQLCEEIGAEYVILGKPKSGQERNILDATALDDFASDVEATCGAKVVYAEATRQ